MTSSRLYSLVTKYWPRIAAGLVVVIGLVELVASGLTADSGIEFYLMAWAGATGGLWFLFEKAEKALSDESRARVIALVQHTDLKSGIESIPEQFALLFDRVFGERHLSLACAQRSFVASAAAVGVVSLVVPPTNIPFGPSVTLSLGLSMVLVLPLLLILHPIDKASRPYLRRLGLPLIDPNPAMWRRRDYVALAILFAFAATLTFGAVPGSWLAPILSLVRPFVGLQRFLSDAVEATPLATGVATWLGGVALASVFNFGPDYVSLLQTRWAIRLSDRLGLTVVVLADLLVTACISLGFLWAYFAYVGALTASGLREIDVSSPVSVIMGIATGRGGVFGWERIYFLSAFFTSVWLWLYAASVLLSRVLLRMNSGVGFLLRVTDVERQPFRSMGFVSVIIVSALFALGLPLVLL